MAPPRLAICQSIPCCSKGSAAVLRDIEELVGNQCTVEESFCLGSCEEGPNVEVEQGGNKKVVQHVDNFKALCHLLEDEAKLRIDKTAKTIGKIAYAARRTEDHANRMRLLEKAFTTLGSPAKAEKHDPLVLSHLLCLRSQFTLKTDKNQALKDAEKAVQLNPQWAFGNVVLGTAYEALHKYREANEVLTLALDVGTGIQEAAVSRQMTRIKNFLSNDLPLPSGMDDSFSTVGDRQGSKLSRSVSSSSVDCYHPNSASSAASVATMEFIKEESEPKPTRSKSKSRVKSGTRRKAGQRRSSCPEDVGNSPESEALLDSEDGEMGTNVRRRTRRSMTMGALDAMRQAESPRRASVSIMESVEEKTDASMPRPPRRSFTSGEVDTLRQAEQRRASVSVMENIATDGPRMRRSASMRRRSKSKRASGHEKVEVPRLDLHDLSPAEAEASPVHPMAETEKEWCVDSVTKLNHDCVCIVLHATSPIYIRDRPSDLWHLDVFKGNALFEDELKRSYTPISTFEEFKQGVVRLMVKVYSAGKMTPYLSSLRPGSPVLISPPRSTVQLEPIGLEGFVMVAGGSSITVALQACKFVLSRYPFCVPVHLVLCNRTVDDVLYQGELEKLVQKYGSFSLQHCISGGTLPLPNDSRRIAWKQGRISREDLAWTNPTMRAVVSGPPGLCEAMVRIWEEIDRDPESLSVLDELPPSREVTKPVSVVISL